jgi:hypothetical protein
MNISTNLDAEIAATRANRRPGYELSAYVRSSITSIATVGTSQRQISRILGILRTTIQDTIHLIDARDVNKSLPRSGCPRAYTDRDERHVLYIIRREPKIRWRCLRLSLPLDISLSTFKRLVRKYGIRKWLAKKRPELTEHHAVARLA